MTKQTNAELIADVRSIDSEWVLDNSPDDSVETIRELAARLEAADQRAAELAAVIEQTEDFVTRHYLDMEMGRSLIEVLAIEPGGALREHDAALIEELADDWEALVQKEKPPKRGSLWLRDQARQRREEKG